MTNYPSGSIIEHFPDLEDPRTEHLCQHRRIDIIVILYWPPES